MIVLASASPRRAQLLAQAGVAYVSDPSDCDESFADSLPPEEMVQALSRRKAEVVAKRHANEVVLAADTVVALGDTVLGKPRDRDEAVAMLLSLAGRTHRVCTGVTVTNGSKTETFVSVTRVTFAPFTKEEAEKYAATGECDDKAGAYGVQGVGAVFVERIDGDYFTVVGLPLCETCRVLRTFGVKDGLL